MAREVGLRDGVVARQRRRRDRDLQQRGEMPAVGLVPSSNEGLPTVHEHHDITGLDVRRRVLEEAEVVAGRVVEAVGRHGASSIEKLAAL
jgi:hypothetical protein